MKNGSIVALMAALVLAGCASTKLDDVKTRAASVRFAQDKEEIKACQLPGIARDADMDDLQKKATQLGGNTALIVDHVWAWPMHTHAVAQVYKCEPR